MDPIDQVSERTPLHRWKPIEDLPADTTALTAAAAEVSDLRRAWAGKKRELESSGALREFNERLSRQWCIETGILEGIYTLDRGATQTLIEHGFDAALLSHGDTDVGETRLIQILRDHERAIEGLFAFVKQDRPLSTSYIRQLHQALVAHQDTCEGIDQFGNERHVPLLKGEWKRLPNDPSDVHTGTVVHEYCPPEHVAAEMDRLISMHTTHEGTEPEVSAAWLHHRFVQIHPFQDGNGRVARALATLVLIQRGGFPFVVLRDDKPAYIDALRAADNGDLVPFVEFVCRLQKAALLRAMESGTDALTSVRTLDAILDDASARLRTSSLRRDEPVHRVAVLLRDRAAVRIDTVVRKVGTAIAILPDASASASTSRPATEGQHDLEILHAGETLGYDADTTGPRPWIEIEIRHGSTTKLIVSFHRVGHADSLVMAATVALVRQHADGEVASSQICSSEPFTFTADREPAELTAAFDAWLERALTLGLEIWRRSL